jgi:ACS family sodium-dependent inorganic phosphate cotransporter-like MFS transporter 5
MVASIQVSSGKFREIPALKNPLSVGFKINHLDITPRFAGILMAITNCTANFAGLLAPMAAGNIIDGKPTIAQWRIVFLIAAVVYFACATFYNIFASGERQKWDNPELDNLSSKAVDNENGLKNRNNSDVQETRY